MILAVVAALLSAVGFAVSTSLQHHASGKADSQFAFPLFKRLVRQPLWFLGLVIGGVAFGLHAVALAHGPLALVQPIVVSGVVLALPARAALDRRRLSLREFGWIVLAGIGLAMFVVSIHPSIGDHGTRTTTAAWTAVIGLLLAGVLTIAAGAVEYSHRRALLLGGASGVLFGLVAGLVKMVASGVAAEGFGALLGWPLWALILTGVGGVALNQRAYQAGPLSVSMPLLNGIDICVAIAFGFLVFGETPAHRPDQIVAELVGFGLAALSVWRLIKHASYVAVIEMASRQPVPLESSPQ